MGAGWRMGPRSRGIFNIFVFSRLIFLARPHMHMVFLLFSGRLEYRLAISTKQSLCLWGWSEYFDQEITIRDSIFTFFGPPILLRLYRLKCLMLFLTKFVPKVVRKSKKSMCLCGLVEIFSLEIWKNLIFSFRPVTEKCPQIPKFPSRDKTFFRSFFD